MVMALDNIDVLLLLLLLLLRLRVQCRDLRGRLRDSTKETAACIYNVVVYREPRPYPPCPFFCHVVPLRPLAYPKSTRGSEGEQLPEIQKQNPRL
ncbi:uncharacterized protein K452DRAFT_119926 [Aplosporella prunicola CBS 121167]|uniref:Secreted protein n=1 Tax=Aplosporella prunicola CBS 121167 TaxID=1176127 RepID=A0A6A6BMZ2_9PEZI|nr:uncharacterized protein K452DRAFT_119926 [Aplosporella prunicola CBS 121167]KAF2145446.1 hypothetical protein K452DRAFT_119926 [Aplosporella prunicola CBS 121167]